MLTNFCVSLINHCEAFTDTDFGPLIIETTVGANQVCFPQEKTECLLEFMLHRGFCRDFRRGRRNDIVLKPLMLSLQMLKCSIKNVVVSGNLLYLPRKREEDLYPLRVITC